jgi:hypothetical protein
VGERQPYDESTESAERTSQRSGRRSGNGLKEESWVTQLSVILTLAVGIVAALRLLAVATWSRRTAMVILQTTGTTQVITGALISTMGIAGGFAFGTYVTIRAYHLAGGRQRPLRGDWLVLAAFVVVIVLIAPLVVAIPVLGASVVVAAVGRRRGSSLDVTRRGRAASADTARFWTLVVGGAAALIAVFADPRPWLPPENIAFKPDSHVQSGYVLHLDEHDLTMLVGDRPRTVLHIVDPQIAGREVCGGRSKVHDSSLVKNLMGLTPYPPCKQQV